MLLPEDDAATANWGDDWCMPTYEDFVELMENTTQEWMTFAGVSGMKFTSKAEGNTNFIFLPAAGYRGDGSLSFQSTNGSYWPSTVTLRSNYARNLNFHSGGANTTYSSRCYGFSVRPVLKN
ncbi:MAG: hypothetical protein J6Z14_02175 [Prevotella sp.]|nr:hypothetical protein [Prevotella sp.]